MTAAIARAGAAAATAQVSLCVEVLPRQQSGERGQATQWAVYAWATGGTVPDATLRLQANPAGAGTPHFSFGCGSADGTASCDLGAVNAGSAQRQFQAELTVPLTATTVTSASLTAIGGAANLHTAPEASAAITILAPASPIGISASLPGLAPVGVAAPIPTLSPGGSATGLFPAIDPGSPSPAPEGARPAANTSSAYTGAASPVGAEVAGLAALALAFVLALTRISIRRPVPSSTAAASPPGAPAEPASRPDDPGEPRPDDPGEPSAENAES